MTMAELSSKFDDLLSFQGHSVFSQYSDYLKPKANAHAQREYDAWFERTKGLPKDQKRIAWKIFVEGRKMPDRVNDYIRYKVSDNRGFTVKGASFDAITVKLGDRRITLHIGGLPTGIQGKDFPMPADPAMLRELADALRMAAVDVEARWVNRDGGRTPGWKPPVTEGELYSY